MNPSAETQVPLATREFWAAFVADQTAPKVRSEYRRKNIRYAVVREVRAFYERDGRHIATDVDIMEISATGMSIRARSQIEPEAVIRIQFNDVEQPFAIEGRVMHSTGTLGGHKIGLELLFAPSTDADQ